MSDETAAAATEEPLAFDRAEFAAPEDAAPACALCKRDLGQSYFTINGTIACEDCHHLVSTQVKDSKGFGAFVRAAGFGAAAAVGGSIAWYAVAKITGMEIGLLAIAVGYVVGKAVRHGARGPGGRRYQALAIVLTYLSITGSYVPLVLKTLTETPPAAHGVIHAIVLGIAVVALSLAAPFLAGASNIIGIFLIGIALYEAWKFNRPVPLVMEGPLRTKKVRGGPIEPATEG